MTVTSEDAAAIGRAIYNDKIRNTLGPEYRGKIVVIDVYSGDYEIGDRDIEATSRLLKRRPDAYTLAERVGSAPPIASAVQAAWAAPAYGQVDQQRGGRQQ